MACITNHIDIDLWDVITYPCPDFSSGLAKPPLKSGMDGEIYPTENDGM